MAPSEVAVGWFQPSERNELLDALRDLTLDSKANYKSSPLEDILSNGLEVLRLRKRIIIVRLRTASLAPVVFDGHGVQLSLQGAGSGHATRFDGLHQLFAIRGRQLLGGPRRASNADEAGLPAVPRMRSRQRDFGPVAGVPVELRNAIDDLEAHVAQLALPTFAAVLRAAAAAAAARRSSWRTRAIARRGRRTPLRTPASGGGPRGRASCPSCWGAGAPPGRRSAPRVASSVSSSSRWRSPSSLPWGGAPPRVGTAPRPAAVAVATAMGAAAPRQGAAAREGPRGRSRSRTTSHSLLVDNQSLETR
mmetsp:Transcript_12596/g.19095  ORF Transcript_12596/g.19095 Transcript_12596/m.19095 type:complete len:306 (-) Transcript_12596:12-929(-)